MPMEYFEQRERALLGLSLIHIYQTDNSFFFAQLIDCGFVVRRHCQLYHQGLVLEPVSYTHLPPEKGAV